MNLYHLLLRGKHLRDDMLYTLNDLKAKHPDLYDLNVAKYSERLQILEHRIPQLDCGWSDVVFLCPVHSDKVCMALARHRGRLVPEFPFQAIPVADLDPAKLVIWLYHSQTFDPKEVLPFDPMLLEQLQDIPAATTAYFAEQRVKKEPALLFVHIPHVLHKGSIDMGAYPVCLMSAYEPTA